MNGQQGNNFTFHKEKVILMLDRITTNQDFKPENPHAARHEGVIVNSICSQAFSFGDNMSRFKRKKICFYCGQPATHQFKNGKWCCESNVARCPSIRKINSAKNVNNQNAKGYKHTEEFCQKQSKQMKGKNNPWYGKKRPDISKILKENNPMRDPEVITRISGKNHHMNQKTAQKISRALKGRKYPERSGKNHPNYGKKIHTNEFRMTHSKRMRENPPAKRFEVRKKISAALKALGESHPNKRPEIRKKISDSLVGDKHWNWQGGISCDPYCDVWTDREYKESILERDDHTCQNPDCWETSKRIMLHHINYNKKDCHPNNLIAVCGSCNIRANFNRKYWQKLYQGIIKEKYENR